MPKKKETPAAADRLVAYYRYSGGSGQTEQSIEGQRRDCQAWAKSHGLTICHEYIDRHISGKTDNRAQFQRMMEDSDKGAFDILICWKTDRLARNRYDSAIYKNRLRKNGVKIVYAAESSVDGPEGIILEGLMESLAEYYSAELSQKLRRGQRESALKCHSLGGYHALGLTANKNKEFVIDESQAPTVRYIFEQYAAGQSSAAIVADLNSKGKRTATGGLFNKNSIMRIVTNEQYIGTYYSKAHDVRVENAIPAIIDRELWDKVQATVKKNRAGRAKNAVRANYMLSGKLFCKLCDGSMKGISGTGRHGEKHYYYSCPRHLGQGCEKANIEKTYLENLIVSATAEYILSPRKLEQIADQVIAVQIADQHRPDPERDMLEAELSENLRKQDNIMRAIEDGTASARLSSRLGDLEQQEAALRHRLSLMEDPPDAAPTYDRDQLIFMLSQFQRGPDEQDEDYKQRVIDTFVRSVYLTNDTAFVQFNITDPTNTESITLEGVMLDLLGGESSGENPDISGLPAGFNRVSFGGPPATPDEPYRTTVIVAASTILLCIQNIPASRS
jgi:DNA invertase Pin-like site-specific DNA recombinase